MKLKNNFPLLGVGIFCVFLYRYLLDIMYFDFIAVHHEGIGFCDSRTEERFVVSWLMVFFSIPFLRKWLNPKNENGSTDIVFFVYILSYLPFSTGVYAGLVSWQCVVYCSTYFVFLFFLHSFWYQKDKSKKLLLQWKRIPMNRAVILGCFACIVVSVLGISLLYTGGRLNFSLSSNIVYALREEAREYHFPFYLGYILSMAIPFLSLILGRCIINKDFGCVAFIWFVILLHFGIDGAKYTFFIPIAVTLAVMFYRRFTATEFRLCCLASFIAFLLLGIIENLSNACSLGFIENFIIRRVMFVPVKLHEVYWLFFSLNEYDFFRGSFLRHFGFSSPYTSLGGIPRTIGYFLGNPEMNANNGLFSDAVANWGIAGIVIMPVFIVFVLRMFDRCTAGLDRRLTVVGAMMLSLSLISSSLGTVLVTHGALLLMFMMALMEKKRIRRI